MGWPGPATNLQVLVWQAFFRIVDGERDDLSMDGLVPSETQERWRSKVAAAHARVAEIENRKMLCRSEAQRRRVPWEQVYEEKYGSRDRA